MNSLAVVIPTLNEAAVIHRTVTTTKIRLPGACVLVVDGGSTDGTPAIAAEAGAKAFDGSRGRGAQCHAGALQATTEWLLFLHADTTLPSDAAAAVACFVERPKTQIATFRLTFDQPGWFLRACCWFTRFDSVFTRFGDQGILIRRSFYHEIGGFPEWPLFEDVALLQRARRRAKIHSLRAAVTTSARRFQANGHVRQQWLNARLLARYLCGASPHVLAEDYRTSRRRVIPPALAPTSQEQMAPP